MKLLAKINYAARAARLVFRAVDLDAAGGGRRWPDAPTGRDQASFAHAGASTIAARAARYSVNTPQGARITSTLADNLVGKGIKVRSLHPSDAVRDRLARDFEIFSEQSDADRLADFHGLTYNAARDLAVYGEALLIFTGDTATGMPQLRRLHPEQLDRTKTTRLDVGRMIHQGIEFDAAGHRVAYWLRPGAPGEALAGLPSASLRQPAGDVIHVFRPLFPGQIRGLSWFAPILLPAHDLDQLADAMLVRAKVAAMFAGFVTDPDGEGVLEGTQTGSALDVSLEPGTLVNLPLGKSITMAEPPDAGNAPAFMQSVLRTLSAGAGITYEQLTGDYSQVNYSSARAALLEFRRFCGVVQRHTLIFQICRPVWRRFIMHQVLTGRISATAFQANPSDYLAVKWLPPAWGWVDPLKDAQAAVLEMTNGLKSRTEIVAERGYDIEVLDREIAADQARAARLGIVMPAAVPSQQKDEAINAGD